MENSTPEKETNDLGRILSYVNQISLELATLPHNQNIYALITKKLIEATGAMGATFGDYDLEEQEVVLKHIETESQRLKTAGKILGYSLMNVRATVSEVMYRSMVTNQVSFRQNLTEATFGEIPIAVSTLFMKTLNVGYFIGLAYVVDGNLYGTSVLAFKTNFPEPSMPMLKTLCNIIAVSLSRHKTEVHLQQSIKALRASEEKFRNISEQLNDTIFLTDTQGTILYLSPAAKHLFGYELREMLGKNFILFLHKAEIKTALTQFQTAINNNQKRESIILRMMRKSGDTFHGELVSGNVHEDGKISGTLGIIRDISDRIKSDEEIKQLNEELELRVQKRTAELEAANKEMESFSYTVSHDLRSPLRSIEGFSSILIEENHHQLNEEGQKNLKRVIDATHYMGQLIDDMLNLTRLHKTGIQLVELNISDLVQKEFETLALTEPDRDVELSIQENIFAKGDKTLIHNAIQNLVGNAWKFTSTREKAIIKFGVNCVDDKLTFFLEDNGVGFDMRYYDKLFNPFQRLHPRHEFPGTGIGLASVKRIITKHKGEIWADSQIGIGSTFYFRLGE